MEKFIKSIRYFTRKSNASRLGAYSAQTAFFMFFSLIPLIMLLFSLMSRIGYSAEEIIESTKDYISGVFGKFLTSYLPEITAEGKLSLTIVSAVALLWSASRGVYSIIAGFNSVNEIKEERNYFLLRLTAMLYTFAFIVIIVIALLLMVFGNYIGGLFYDAFPELKGLVYIISSLRFIIGFVALILFFMLVYKSLPSCKIKFSEQMPGAVLSSAGWVSFSILFSFFVDNFGNYSNIYGSLTAIIVLMLWLYICMYIMFFGAELNFILSGKARKSEELNDSEN
ncbi:MAG: YihY/virulence factor BrkB family protein [Clostridiales bacterium]|nr:YihY/virulence factor BrkB family protein [Candidatus Coliplasma equi]